MNHGLKSRGLVVARPALASAAPMSQQQQLQLSASATNAPSLATHAMAAAKCPHPHPPGWKLWHHSNGIKFGSLLPSQPRPRPLDHGCFASHRALHTFSDGTPWEPESAGSGLSTSSGWVDERKTASTLFRGVAEALAPSDRDPPTTEAEDEAAKEVVPEDEDVEPPATTLDYKFPPEAFRLARRAPPDSPASFWSYSYYRGPGNEKVRVHYCRSRDTTERVCRYFLDERLLGFDLEWAPDANRFSGPRRNVALVQLANQSRIALFHLALYPRDEDVTDVSPSLRRIMEDPAITKCGVSIKADCTRLRNYLNIHPQGVFELSHLFRLVKYSRTGETRLINKRLVSLAEQTQTVLGLPLYKGLDVRWSQWSKPLQMDQILYSASDAYAAVHIYDILEQQRQSLKPTPPRPYNCELELPIRLAEPEPDGAGEEEAVVAEEEEAEEAEEAEEVVVEEEEVVEEVEEVMVQEEELAAEEDEELVVEDEDEKEPVVEKEEVAVEEVEEEGELVAEGEELATKEEGLAAEVEEKLVVEEEELTAEESSDEPAELGFDAAVEALERSTIGREHVTETVQMLPTSEIKVAGNATKPRDERLLEAEEWLNQYQDSLTSTTTTTTSSSTVTATTKTTTRTTTTVTTTRKPRTAKAALRIYHVWHENPDLDPAAVAALALGDPPLHVDAVYAYILDAVDAERLPYDAARLRAEVLDCAPESLLERYARLDGEARAAAAAAEQ